jgi:hypothetical protein
MMGGIYGCNWFIAGVGEDWVGHFHCIALYCIRDIE